MLTYDMKKKQIRKSQLTFSEAISDLTWLGASMPYMHYMLYMPLSPSNDSQHEYIQSAAKWSSVFSLYFKKIKYNPTKTAV